MQIDREVLREVEEGAAFARNRLEMMCDDAWNGDARDFKRSLSGVFAEFDAALARLRKAMEDGKDGCSFSPDLMAGGTDCAKCGRTWEDHEDQWGYGTWDARKHRGYEREYVRADLLEAAQARIKELEAELDHAWDHAAKADGRVISSIAESIEDKVALRSARREAFRECAAIADDWFARSGHGSPGDDIRAKIDGGNNGDG